MHDPGNTPRPAVKTRVAAPTLSGWLGLLGLIALAFAGAAVTGRLLGRALFFLFL